MQRYHCLHLIETSNGIKAAIKKPREIPLIECEFPPLGALNKLGDGSLRSSLEAEAVSVCILFECNVAVVLILIEMGFLVEVYKA